MKLQTKKVRPNYTRPAPFGTDPARAESITATILPATGKPVNGLETHCGNLLFSISQPSSQILAAMCAECAQKGW